MIHVSDSNKPQGTNDFLSYWGYDDCNGSYFFGWGEVPDGIIKVAPNGKEVSLSVEVNNALHNFEYYGTPLVADINWKEDGTCNGKFSGQGQDTYTFGAQSLRYKYNSRGC